MINKAELKRTMDGFQQDAWDRAIDAAIEVVDGFVSGGSIIPKLKQLYLNDDYDNKGCTND